MASTTRAKRAPPAVAPDVVYPGGLQKMLGVSLATRWRWERDGRLPPRDFFIGGVAVGWRPQTLEAAFAGPTRDKSAA
jgi:predicted DNA-binding transcriptional regulator AlpA